ncbi:MAG: T9SS type A sorting domain-containing protein [Bacteroidota bacterium]|nr:T9SS type A sorting domain-containing protein [Bacteroidota bacterium]
MKRILLSILAFGLISGTSFAQSIPGGGTGVLQPNGGTVKLPTSKKLNNANRAGRTVSEWYNITDARGNQFGTAYTGISFLLFPDSSVKILRFDAASNTITDANFFNRWYSMGSTLDPKSPGFGNPITDPAGTQLSIYNPYTLDSVRFRYAYIRNTNVSIVDTMIVQWFTPRDEFFYGTDTTNRWHTYTFSRAPGLNRGLARSTTTTIPQPITVRIPLTTADSTSLFIDRTIATNKFSVAAGQNVACMVTFKSGLNVSFGDTVVYPTDPDVGFQEPKKKFNNFYIQNAVTSGHVFDDNLSNGMFLLTRNLYRDVITGLVSRYTPSQYYNNYLYPNVDFLLTSKNVSIGSVAKDGYSIGDIYPNPANTSANLGFELAKNEQVKVSLFNVIGQPIATIANGNYTAGKHTITFDVANLKAGVYFANVQAGNSTRTVKFSVQ